MAKKKTFLDTVALNKNKVLLFIVVFALSFVAVTIVTSKYEQSSTSLEISENKGQSAKVDLDSLVSKISVTYNGAIPWKNANDKQAYQFFVRELAGLKIGTDKVGVNHDSSFNPITVIDLDEEISIPIKNSYVTYYEIPKVLYEKYGLKDDDFVMPVGL